MSEKLRLSTHQFKIIFHNLYVLLGLSPLISLSLILNNFSNVLMEQKKILWLSPKKYISFLLLRDQFAYGFPLTIFEMNQESLKLKSLLSLCYNCSVVTSQKKKIKIQRKTQCASRNGSMGKEQTSFAEEKILLKSLPNP